MAQITSTFRRDANNVPIWIDGIVVTKTITYASPGSGDTGATTLFTVTGDVKVTVFAVCSTDLTGDTATIEVGIAGNTAALIAQTTATSIDAAEVWTTATPATVRAVPGAFILTNGTDITQTIATAAITAGKLTFYCLWTPLSDDGNVVAA